MNSRPLVSAMIIFLNGERFIEEAIESVFAQTYDNWELLLVDDGSTDGSTQIALRYAEQHPGKMHYLEHPGHQNRGMSASRNLGVRYAKGEYIAFLDHDDVWLPHALERQVAIFGSYPEAGMVYGSTQVWYSWTGNSEDSQRDFRTLVGKEGDAKLNMLLEPPTGLLNNLLQPLAPPESLVPSICSALLRREVVERVGGWEEEFQGLYEDQVLYIKVGLQAPVFVASECWSRYRQRPDSSWNSSLKKGQRHSARVFFLNWIAEYLYKQGIEDVETWKLLQEAQLGAYTKQLDRLKRVSDRQLTKLKREKRDSEKERRRVSQRLAQLEREVKEQRRETRRLRQLLQEARNLQTQNWPNLWLRKLLKKVGHLQARMLRGR